MCFGFQLQRQLTRPERDHEKESCLQHRYFRPVFARLADWVQACAAEAAKAGAIFSGPQLGAQPWGIAQGDQTRKENCSLQWGSLLSASKNRPSAVYHGPAPGQTVARVHANQAAEVGSPSGSKRPAWAGHWFVVLRPLGHSTGPSHGQVFRCQFSGRAQARANSLPVQILSHAPAQLVELSKILGTGDLKQYCAAPGSREVHQAPRGISYHRSPHPHPGGASATSQAWTWVAATPSRR